ncbi:MAG: Tad domain-containing protein [Bdellovibrionales bacterium]|nr:Tad domain-containing protein [Bdellovibrionales bacterium]
MGAQWPGSIAPSTTNFLRTSILRWNRAVRLSRGVVRNSRGNVTLYAAVLMPMALALAVLAVDVSQFQALRERAQQEADRIALLSVRMLPDVTAARAVAEEAVADLGELQVAGDAQGRPLLEVTSSQVAITLEGKHSAVFDVFLRPLDFQVRERAEAQLVPTDAVLIFSDGATLRPTAGSAWGTPGDWPPSKYFQFVANPSPGGERREPSEVVGLDWPDWHAHWHEERYRRWATQSCFNESFSAIKLTAMALADEWSSVATNRFAVLSTPGYNPARPVEVLHALEAVGSDAARPSWSGYFDTLNYLSDEFCALMATPEVSNDYRYALPAPRVTPLRRSSADTSCATFATGGWGSLFFPHGLLSSCYVENALLAREVIYYHAARSVPPPSDGSHVLAALDEASRQLVEANPATLSALQQLRGTLAERPIRRIVFVGDALPDPEAAGSVELLSRLQNLGVQLLLVAFAHPGLSVDAQAEIRRRSEVFAGLGLERVESLLVDEADELVATVGPKLAAGGREYVLRR